MALYQTAQQYSNVFTHFGGEISWVIVFQNVLPMYLQAFRQPSSRRPSSVNGRISAGLATNCMNSLHRYHMSTTTNAYHSPTLRTPTKLLIHSTKKTPIVTTLETPTVFPAKPTKQVQLLRYEQEQQYHKHATPTKPDRTLRSPLLRCETDAVKAADCFKVYKYIIYPSAGVCS